MNEKEKRIILKSMKLFANKGYHATSIKEIADESGIAKGTFYNYFDSKEQLMIAILNRYIEMYTKKLTMVGRDQSFTPKETFLKQIQLQYEVVLKHRDFIELHIKEHTAQENEVVKELFFKIRATQLNWIIDGLRSIYGNKIEPYIFDCASLVNGIIGVYVNYIIIDHKVFNIEKLSQYILNRIDDLITGLIKSDEVILNENDFSEFIKINNVRIERISIKVSRFVQNILEKLDEVNLEKEIEAKISSSLDILKDEFFNKEKPNKIVLEGLVLFLRNLQVNSLNSDWDDLQGIINEYEMFA